ncbi:hypothetical protein PoB_006162100 [Plakobranchus ocellatus]|uniref:Uncharacterized protein n=1 Tax=Plakobranchus ocellatus TaxID=259542 RepID=A0AAV4CTT4_9GAST|nr:hypothetical protein PoB_006162100 [Plakobranchus ocellatus]
MVKTALRAIPQERSPGSEMGTPQVSDTQTDTVCVCLRVWVCGCVGMRGEARESLVTTHIYCHRHHISAAAPGEAQASRQAHKELRETSPVVSVLCRSEFAWFIGLFG